MKLTGKMLKAAVELERLFGTDIALAGTKPVAAKPRKMTLDQVREWVNDCKKCGLHKGRTHIVFGEGDPKARLVFVGEGPGADEDAQGRPFVGRAGQILTKIIENVLLLRREDVYIANIVKCRPPGNRTPLPDECATCIPYLRSQLDAIAPEIIVALGSVAAHSLLDTDVAIGKLRGRFCKYGETRLMCTYHPAYLLRNPGEKRKVFEDMLQVKEALGISAGTGG
jgi:DNA polymerase